MRIFFGIIIGLIVAVAIAVTAGKYAFGSLGNVGERDKSKDVSQVYELTDFDRISVGGVFEIDVTAGGDYAVTLYGAPDVIARMEPAVENGVLHLDQGGGSGKVKWRDQGVSAVITMPSIRGVSVAGVADADVTGIDASSFKVSLSGVGNVSLSGTCESLTADVSGVGELGAEDFECRTVDVDVSGVGSARVFASEEADAAVSGIGSIDIYGSPQRVRKTSTFLANISVK